MKFISLALFVEIFVTSSIIFFHNDAKINWGAYTEVVKNFIDGELSYDKLRSDTGSVAGAGGFVWLFSALYYVTRTGTAIELARWLFGGVFWITLAMVLSLYQQAQLSWFSVLSLLLSRSLHNVYLLKLSMNCWAMLFLYWSVWLLAVRRCWMLGVLLFSVAVSIKVEALFMAPGLLYVLACSLSLCNMLICLAFGVAWQLVVGYPFLLHDFRSYLHKGFQLERISHTFSVNYKFISPELFDSPHMIQMLMTATVIGWTLLWRLRWRNRQYVPTDGMRQVAKETEDRDCNSEGNYCYTKTIALTLFESHLIGIAMAHSLQYESCVLFFYMVPFALRATKYPRIFALFIFAIIFHGFEMKPLDIYTSSLVMAGMLMMVSGILFFGEDFDKKMKENMPKKRKKSARKGTTSLGRENKLEKRIEQ